LIVKAHFNTCFLSPTRVLVIGRVRYNSPPTAVGACIAIDRRLGGRLHPLFPFFPFLFWGYLLREENDAFSRLMGLQWRDLRRFYSFLLEAIAAAHVSINWADGKLDVMVL
jgi:hypothetical protein